MVHICSTFNITFGTSLYTMELFKLIVYEERILFTEDSCNKASVWTATITLYFGT